MTELHARFRATAAVVLRSPDPVTSLAVSDKVGLTLATTKQHLAVCRRAGLIDVAGGGASARWASPKVAAEIRSASAARNKAHRMARDKARREPPVTQAPALPPNSIFALGDLLRQDETT